MESLGEVAPDDGRQLVPRLLWVLGDHRSRHRILRGTDENPLLALSHVVFPRSLSTASAVGPSPYHGDDSANGNNGRCGRDEMGEER